jgi:site-specific DNA recombinase
LVGTRAAIYARISLDRKEGAGVARQLADCRALASERGYEVVGEYVDNDVSAVRKKRRPEFDRMRSDLGTFDVLIAYHPDRLYRNTRDLEDLIDATEGLEVVTVKAGDMDLGSATGRMVARLLGATSRHESDRIGERVARAKKERAVQGLPSGGGMRPFGWKLDRVTPEPREAAALVDAAERVAAGGSVGLEARRLNAQGFLTSGGRPWTHGALLRVLMAPRISGMRQYKGVVVGEAAWPSLIDEQTRQRIVVMASGRRGGSRPQRRKSLLSGLISCAYCSQPLYLHGATQRWPSYACLPSTRRDCRGSAIIQHAADTRVLDDLVAHLNRTDLEALVGTAAPSDASGELDAIRAKRGDLTDRWARDLIGDDVYDQGLAVLAERESELEAPVVKHGPYDRDLILRAITGGDVAEQRSVVVALVESITLRPERMPDPGDRLVIVYR